MGRHQDADHAVAYGVLVVESVARPEAAVETEEVGSFGGIQGASPGALGEVGEGVELAGFGLDAESIDPAEVGGRPFEVFADRSEDGFRGA